MSLSPGLACAMFLSVAAWGVGDVPRSRTSADTAFEPALKVIESRMPLYEDVESEDIQAPSPTITLGLSTKIYQCWKLKLTSEHGRQVYESMSRLQALQKELSDLKGKLAQDLLLYQASLKDPGLQQRVLSQYKALDATLSAYNQLLDFAIKAGLVKVIEKGLWKTRRTISPRMKDDDYTMIYDASSPECASHPTK